MGGPCDAEAGDGLRPRVRNSKNSQVPGQDCGTQVGHRPGEENPLQPEKPGKDQQGRDQEQDLSGQTEDHGGAGLADRLEVA